MVMLDLSKLEHLLDLKETRKSCPHVWHLLYMPMECGGLFTHSKRTHIYWCHYVLCVSFMKNRLGAIKQIEKRAVDAILLFLSRSCKLL